MIVKIVIASIIIYIVYRILQHRKVEGMEIGNKKLLDSCKSKCDDTYKKCLQNHCSDVIESNQRRKRRIEVERIQKAKIKRDRKCISKCDSIKRDEDKSLCTLKCYRGNQKLNEKMRSCYTRCDQDHKDSLDHDKCIAQCHIKEINLDREMSQIKDKVLEGFNTPFNGANLNTAKNPVKSPSEKKGDSLDFNGFVKYVNSKEIYTLPEILLRELFNRINNSKERVEKEVYKTYRIYLNNIPLDYNMFNQFANLNSFRVLTNTDRKKLFKHLDSSGTGLVNYSRIVKGTSKMPITYSYESFVNIMRIYLKRLGLLNEFREVHYRRLFELAKIKDNRPNELIETMDGGGNVVDATRVLNDNAARMNPMRMTDLTADSDVTGTRNYLLNNELDILLNPIIRDMNGNKVNKLLDRVLNDNDKNIKRDLAACNAIGRERIQLAPVVNSDDIDKIVQKVRTKMQKCLPPIKPPKIDKKKNELENDVKKYNNTEDLINSIGKDLINSGLFKSYVQNKCGFFCPADDKILKDDKPLMLPRQMREGTVYDIWNPKSIQMNVTPSNESLSGRDLSYRNTDYWNRVPRKVLDKVCSDKNCLVKPYND